MGKVRTDGLMKECILVRLIITKCTGEENSHGLMVGSMKANISKIRNKAKVFIHGQTVVDTMENG